MRQRDTFSVANINLATFQQRLVSGSVDELITDALADDDPWLFREDTASYEALKEHLRERLGLGDMTCVVVGSAKYGFSISPDTFGQPFRESSDIDVALFSASLFDEFWNSLLRWRYPWHTRKWQKSEAMWAVNHMEDHIAGSVDPLRVRVRIHDAMRIPTPVRDRVTQWFDAFRLAENIGPARGHTVEGRIYRTEDHLKHYLRWGLGLVRNKLGEQQ